VPIRVGIRERPSFPWRAPRRSGRRPSACFPTDPIREEQEGLLGQLVRETPDDDPDKPDILFRLAERYAQQARLFRLQAIGVELSEP
jgi:hypothetical protein